jgi:F0F1-type ATP synthase delta subunit
LPLTSDEQIKVKSDLGAADAEFTVDPGILGGLVVRVGDKVIDGSVANKVNAMRSQLSA